MVPLFWRRPTVFTGSNKWIVTLQGTYLHGPSQLVSWKTVRLCAACCSHYICSYFLTRNQIHRANIFYVIIRGVFWPADAAASSELVEVRAEAFSSPLIPTHALQMPCQHLKSTVSYFSPGGKDQLVDHYDPISLPAYWRCLIAVGQISHFGFRWQIYHNLYQVLNRLHDLVNRNICSIKKTTRRQLVVMYSNLHQKPHSRCQSVNF